MATDSQNEREFDNIILELNKNGLAFLTQLKFTDAFIYFKQAEKVIEAELKINQDDPQLNKFAGITYNNLACYYKKISKPKISLIYLEKALEVEVFKVEDWTSTASTHLNICAIYSYLKNHEAAANHAQLALNMLAKLEDEQKKQPSQMDRSIMNLYMLSHYNLAVELEHLKRFQQSLEEFKKARYFAKSAGKKNIGILASCDESIQRIEQELKNLKNKLIKMVTKKKVDQEKGYYLSMRKNKKNFRIRESDTSLGVKLQKYREYEEKPHQRVKSFMKFKTEQGRQMPSKFSYFPSEN